MLTDCVALIRYLCVVYMLVMHVGRNSGMNIGAASVHDSIVAINIICCYGY